MQQELNLAFQDYKINVLLAKLNNKGLKIENSKQLNNDMTEYIEIPLEDNTIQDRINLAVIKAIDGIEVDNIEDELVRTEMLLNIEKFLSNYEELRPIMESHFNKKRYERER